MKLNSLVLPITEAEELVKQLNELLANFQVYYQNLRGLHWNIKGKRFFDLHLKFEELYNDSQLKIVLIAERVLTLGSTPLHTFSDYISISKMKVGKNISNGSEAVKLILESKSVLLQLERVILKNTAAIKGEGTNSMISDFIVEQEKTNWMFKAWLEKAI